MVGVGKADYAASSQVVASEVAITSSRPTARNAFALLPDPLEQPTLFGSRAPISLGLKDAQVRLDDPEDRLLFLIKHHRVLRLSSRFRGPQCHDARCIKNGPSKLNPVKFSRCAGHNAKGIPIGDVETSDSGPAISFCLAPSAHRATETPAVFPLRKNKVRSYRLPVHSEHILAIAKAVGQQAKKD